jgi:hypothetical protein
MVKKKNGARPIKKVKAEERCKDIPYNFSYTIHLAMLPWKQN